MDALDASALVAVAAICGPGPLALAVAAGRRTALPLRIVAIAAGFYLLNLVLQLPLFLGLRPLARGAGLLVTAAVLPSVVYGVCEEVMRYLSWRAGPAMREHRTSDGAIVAGLAWGGVESLLFTASLVAGAVSAGTTAATLAAFLLGRACAVTVHVGLAHLSVAAQRTSALLLPLVIVAHVVVDAAVFGLTVVLGPASPWPPVVFAGFAAAAVLVSVRLRRSWAVLDCQSSALDTAGTIRES